jgi:hypothetical protein
MMLQHISPHFVAQPVPSTSPPPPSAPDSPPPQQHEIHHPIHHHREPSPELIMRPPDSPPHNVYKRPDEEHYQPHRPVPLPASAPHYRQAHSPAPHSPNRSPPLNLLPPPSSNRHLPSHMEVQELIKRRISEENLRIIHEQHRRLILKEECDLDDDEKRYAAKLMNEEHYQRQRHYYPMETVAEIEEQQYRQSIRDYPVKEEDDDTPLDLSLSSKPKRRDSCTDSDDSGGPGEDRGQGGAAYKKSLMKRYCK